MLLRIPHCFQRGNDGLEWRIEADEDINRPHERGAEEKVAIGGGSPKNGGIRRVECNVILEEDLEDDVHREDVLVQGNASADRFNRECNVLPRRCLVVRHSLAVRLLDLVGPGVANGGHIAVVGCVVNVEANVVVAGLVGIVVVELSRSVLAGKGFCLAGKVNLRCQELG